MLSQQIPCIHETSALSREALWFQHPCAAGQLQWNRQSYWNFIRFFLEPYKLLDVLPIGRHQSQVLTNFFCFRPAKKKLSPPITTMTTVATTTTTSIKIQKRKFRSFVFPKAAFCSLFYILIKISYWIPMWLCWSTCPIEKVKKVILNSSSFYP